MGFKLGHLEQDLCKRRGSPNFLVWMVQSVLQLGASMVVGRRLRVCCVNESNSSRREKLYGPFPEMNSATLVQHACMVRAFAVNAHNKLLVQSANACGPLNPLTLHLGNGSH